MTPPTELPRAALCAHIHQELWAFPSSLATRRSISRESLKIQLRLEETGASVYVAEYSAKPGEPLAGKIEEAVRGCDFFLLMLSATAKTSEWVEQEIGIATGLKKPIMPLVLHEGVALPGFIHGLKYLPYYEDPDSAVEWLRTNVAELVRKKGTKDALVALGVIGAILWLLSQGAE